jgi:acyl carrier protein
MKIIDAIRSVVAEKLSVDESRVTAEATFREALGADSLATMELLIAVEERFGIEVPDEDAVGILTVSDLCSYIEQRIGRSTVEK